MIVREFECFSVHNCRSLNSFKEHNVRHESDVALTVKSSCEIDVKRAPGSKVTRSPVRY